MSHFYGTLQGNRGPATRCGTKSSGIKVVAASWRGCITVSIYHEKPTAPGGNGRDIFVIHQEPWHGKGFSELIAHGELGDFSGAEVMD